MKLLLFFLWLPLIATARTSFKTELEKAALRFFLDHSHPVTGLTRDKAPNFVDAPATNRVASIASTGFSLAVITNAAKRGLVERGFAEDYTLRTLRFAREHVPRRKGWFLHWVDWETGARAWNSEYSPIDTALFVAGALYAAQVFPGGQIQALAEELYRDMDFHDYLTDGGTKPWKKTLSLSYSPERGFEPYQWEIYAEQKILLILGLGHPTRPLPLEAWKAWRRYHSSHALMSGIMGHNMPLFIHQYSPVFLDFRSFNDGNPNYFHNGVRATWLHREMLRVAPQRTFREGFWGVSAGEDPEGYRVYDPTSFKGTVCIGCTIASAMYTPQVVTDAEAWKKGAHASRIWGRYGFVDGLDLERGWYAQNVLGITVGPAYMSLANMQDSTSIWQDFMQVPAIKRAMLRAQGR